MFDCITVKQHLVLALVLMLATLLRQYMETDVFQQRHDTHT